MKAAPTLRIADTDGVETLGVTTQLPTLFRRPTLQFSAGAEPRPLQELVRPRPPSSLVFDDDRVPVCRDGRK